jgi:hypothetical protein
MIISGKKGGILMKKLPLGYFAVQSDFENAPKDSFTYRGEIFEVKEGENLLRRIG